MWPRLWPTSRAARSTSVVIGKASFDEKALAENYGAALDEILRAKPSSSKGRYLKKVVVSTTTGPGIPVDPSVTRNFAEA
jgi:large subunit ribosomal protein L1